MTPPPRPPYSVLDWFAEGLGLAGLLAGVGYLLARYTVLPERIPLHFSSGGNPDRLGGKGELFAVLAIVLFILATNALTARFLHQLDAWSVRIQPGRQPLNNGQFTATRTFLLWLNAELSWMFAFIFYETIQVGLGNQALLDEPVILGFLIVMGATLVVYVVALVQAGLRRA